MIGHGLPGHPDGLPRVPEGAPVSSHFEAQGVIPTTFTGVRALLQMVRAPRRLLADRAYDARSLRGELAERHIEAVIPPNPTRKHLSRYDTRAYRGRNIIERVFCRLKDFRRIATRYDKRADMFLSAAHLAAAIA